MPKFEAVSSIKYKCEDGDLKHGQRLWAVLIITEGVRKKKESFSVVPCVVMRRHDNRDDKGWRIMYDLKFPVVKGLGVEWQTLWSDARKSPEEEQPVEWQVGDKAWFYDDGDELVKHGILKGTDINGCWEIEYTYIRQDNQTEKELFTRGPGGIWKSAEAAAEAVAEDLRVEIIENSLSLYDEQWEREHGQKQAEDR